MTLPFFCVVLAFVLIMLAKIPVGIAMAKRPGGYDNHHPRDQQAELEGWGRRGMAAHLNAIEAFPGFAAAVIIAHLGSADPEWSSRLAVTFVVARVAYWALYLADIAIARSTVWTVGYTATIALFLLPLFK